MTGPASTVSGMELSSSSDRRARHQSACVILFTDRKLTRVRASAAFTFTHLPISPVCARCPPPGDTAPARRGGHSCKWLKGRQSSLNPPQQQLLVCVSRTDRPSVAVNQTHVRASADEEEEGGRRQEVDGTSKQPWKTTGGGRGHWTTHRPVGSSWVSQSRRQFVVSVCLLSLSLTESVS